MTGGGGRGAEGGGKTGRVRAGRTVEGAGGRKEGSWGGKEGGRGGVGGQGSEDVHLPPNVQTTTSLVSNSTYEQHEISVHI